MTVTYKQLYTYTATGNVATLTFSNIPQTYTDLIIKISARGDAAGNEIRIGYNGSTSNTTNSNLYGSGTTAGQFQTGYSYAGDTNGTGSGTNAFGSIEIYLPNYASATTYKNYLSNASMEGNVASQQQTLNTQVWAVNDALTSLTIYTNSPYNFVQYSTFYLYGIKNS